jgi:hypothetical protein
VSCPNEDRCVAADNGGRRSERILGAHEMALLPLPTSGAESAATVPSALSPDALRFTLRAQARRTMNGRVSKATAHGSTWPAALATVGVSGRKVQCSSLIA